MICFYKLSKLCPFGLYFDFIDKKFSAGQKKTFINELRHSQSIQVLDLKKVIAAHDRAELN